MTTEKVSASTLLYLSGYTAQPRPGGLNGRKKPLQRHLSVLLKTAGFIPLSLFETTEKTCPG